MRVGGSPGEGCVHFCGSWEGAFPGSPEWTEAIGWGLGPEVGFQWPTPY